MSHSFEIIKESIVCPECQTTQEAEVVNATPFPVYVHECQHCNYMITESDWVKSEET